MKVREKLEKARDYLSGPGIHIQEPLALIDQVLALLRQPDEEFTKTARAQIAAARHNIREGWPFPDAEIICDGYEKACDRLDRQAGAIAQLEILLRNERDEKERLYEEIENFHNFNTDFDQELAERNLELNKENELLKEEARWIPVSERLPEESSRLLAYGKDGYGYEIVAATTYDLKFKKFKILQDVTHWKPIILPEQALKGKRK